MSDDEAGPLIDELLAHASQRQFTYTHRWRVNDLVMWDNRCCLHRGLPFDDLRFRRDMQRVLVELQRELAKTILFITHDLEEALKLGDRIAMLRDGRVEQVATPRDLVERPANDYVAAFVESVGEKISL